MSESRIASDSDTITRRLPVGRGEGAPGATALCNRLLLFSTRMQGLSAVLIHPPPVGIYLSKLLHAKDTTQERDERDQREAGKYVNTLHTMAVWIPPWLTSGATRLDPQEG